jgi:hypothetical protein
MVREEVRLREGNISLVLDSYNDIFSDFDPRPYSERSLSDDFLSECKKAARDKETGIELRLMVPNKKRKYEEEIKIKKRLKGHFQRHFHEKRREIKKIRRIGVLWFLLGFLVMVSATFIYGYPGYFFHFLFIMIEPAGWFFFWEGLEKIFIDVREKKPDYEFYKKMAAADIKFFNY